MEKFLEESVNFDHKYKLVLLRRLLNGNRSLLPPAHMQQKASNELHFSPKQTMRSAQKLYEGGFITYMRTDSKTYSAIFLSTAKKHIQSEYGESYVLPAIKSLSLRKGKGNAQEAHEAIRPTKIQVIYFQIWIGERNVT